MDTGYQIGEAMIRDIISAEPSESILDCAKRMAEKKVGCLIILSENKPLGIVTEQDIARKAVAAEINAGQTPVSEIMSKRMITISPERDLHDAVTLMGTNEIKHLPVIEGDTIVGLLTAKDVVQIEPGLIELLSFKSSVDAQQDHNDQL